MPKFEEEYQEPTKFSIHSACGSAVINGTCVQCNFAPLDQDVEIELLCPTCFIALEPTGLCPECHMLFDNQTTTT